MVKVTLASFREEYNHASDIAKKIQAFRDEAGVPASNELRYAGHHLLQALADDGTIVREDQLIKARNHCRRAAYEAVEAGLSHALRQINKFQEDYRTVEISPVLAEWPDILVDAQAAQKIVAQARPEPEREQKDDHIRHLEAFEKLAPHTEKLACCREELNKRLTSSTRDTRRWLIGIGVTIILGIAGLILTSVLAL